MTQATPNPAPDLTLASTLDCVEVRHSQVHGHGAFATRSVPRGREIGAYAGRRYQPGEAAEKDWDHELTYVFGLSDGSLIDAGDGGNATRHINHSCAPNCVAYEVADEQGVTQVVIQAKRRIRAGEELFLDYALDVGGAAPQDYPCHCGVDECRGTMVAVAPEPDTVSP